LTGLLQPASHHLELWIFSPPLALEVAFQIFYWWWRVLLYCLFI